MISDRLKEIYSQFEQNKLATAFYGDSTFFVKDPVWGRHNRLAMFMHYIRWAAQQTDYHSVLLRSFLLEDLRKNRSLNIISNELEPIATIRIYCQAATIENHWPLSQSDVIDLLFNINKIFSAEEIEKYHIPNDLNLFLKYLPEVAKVIQTLQKEN